MAFGTYFGFYTALNVKCIPRTIFMLSHSNTNLFLHSIPFPSNMCELISPTRQHYTICTQLHAAVSESTNDPKAKQERAVHCANRVSIAQLARRGGSVPWNPYNMSAAYLCESNNFPVDGSHCRALVGCALLSVGIRTMTYYLFGCGRAHVFAGERTPLRGRPVPRIVNK